MQLIAIDIVTSGPDIKSHCVLEMAAIILDPSPPTSVEGSPIFTPGWKRFHGIFKHTYVSGTPDQLCKSADILRASNRETLPPIRYTGNSTYILTSFRQWLDDNCELPLPITVIGNEYDRRVRPYVERIPGWDINIDRRLARKVVDVQSLFFRPSEGVKTVEELLDKAGIRGINSFRAVDKAADVATLMTRVFT